MVSSSDPNQSTSRLQRSHSHQTHESLPVVDSTVSPYERVLRHLSSDATCQREIALGKRIGFYKLGEELGSGNFSKVRIGSHVLTKSRVAIKAIEKSKMDHKAIRLLEREVQNMEKTNHPNIIRLFEVVETLTKLYLVLEYAGGGELYNYVVTKNNLSEHEARPIYAQVVAAVIHLHDLGIIHRDIKAENVFFAATNWVKLGDFGFSVTVKFGDTLNTFCGSPPYAAPELFGDKRYRGEYVDIWALGILLYFMVIGNTPFRGDTVSEMKKRILIGDFEIADHVSLDCQHLIRGMLGMEPAARYSLNSIRDHCWLAKEKFPPPYEKYSSVPDEDELENKPAVKEVYAILQTYGLSIATLKEAARHASKSAMVGMYRILLHRLQTRSLGSLPVGNSPVVNGQVGAIRKSVPHQTSKSCCIL